VATLQTVTKEHRICVDAFKEGHYFLPSIADGPLIPEGYGKAGALVSKYIRSDVEVSHYPERGSPQRRTDAGIRSKGLGYFPLVVSLG